MMHQHDPQSSSPQRSNRSGINPTFMRIVMYTTIAIIVFYLVTEHRAHLAGLWPFSFLFFCLLMHLFMHGGHGGHGGDDQSGGGHAGHGGGSNTLRR